MVKGNDKHIVGVNSRDKENVKFAIYTLRPQGNNIL